MGGFLTALLAPAVLKTLARLIVDKGADLFGQYLRKEISRAELQAKLVPVLVDGFTEVQRIHADSLNKTFATFMQAVVANRLVARVWAIVVLLELAVVVWHQVGIPALVAVTGKPYPPSGDTVLIASGLLFLCLGGGALVMRVGPWSGVGLLDTLKSSFRGSMDRQPSRR